MASVVILQHVDIEGPGLLGEVLRRHGIRCMIIDAVKDRIPETEALIAMGGPMSVNDDDAWLQREMAAIRKHVEAGKPFFGICLGAQLLAKALGGRVTKAAAKEIGSFEVALTAAAEEDALFAALPEQLRVFHWHGETFALPEGAVLLATGGGLNQAFRYRNAYAAQFHLEATESMVRQWIAAYSEEVTTATAKEKVLADFRSNSSDYKKNADAVFGKFAEMVNQQ